MFPIALLTDPNGLAGTIFWIVVTPLVALGPPAAIGIGIVKYRLFDIDVVIRKTVVVTLVGFTLTALYLAVLALATVGQLSRLVVGIALLAVTFNPVRRAARSIADRVAYGRRASSYEVLSSFSERIAGTYAADDIMPRMAAILASGTGAQTAAIWLRVGGELRPVATAGDGTAAPTEPVRLTHDELPALGQVATEVRHNGELLGALSIEMPANDPLDDARRVLIRDLASQAGLVLRNVRLIEELRASRQRLVAAQDEERRKIERNLHDGVQQQLVALAVQLKLARQLVDRDAEKAEVMLDSLQEAATGALDDLRDLARGIYPPLLADKGLAAALEGQARKAVVPTSVEAEGIGRYPRDVEAAVYFCSLEALNNVAKYAGARSASVTLEQRNGSLTFRIADDGVGFDATSTTYGTGLQGIADRLEAIGGSLSVTSAPGTGTVVAGRVLTSAT
jgi:signal transduction histidine kinase